MEKRDHILAVVKAGLSAMPKVGGPIASLIGDYIPTATQRSIKESIEMLKKQLASLESRLDVDAVNKDEFAELFKSCYFCIIRTHQEEKLRAATALISNILLKDCDPDKLSYTELDHYARCIDALSIGAIQTLGHAYNLMQLTGRQSQTWPPHRFNFGDLRRKMGEIEPDLLMGLVAELNNYNLLHLCGDPSVRTQFFDNSPIEFTSLGKKFVERLLKP
jgi:hypothetical protein